MKNVTKNSILTGVSNLILGLLIAVGPSSFFAVCEAMDGKFMKCHWTAQAEIGVGGIIALLGLVLIFIADEKIRLGIQISILPVFAVALLIPDVLIGVCGKSHMQCRALTLPALNVLSIIGVVIGIINVVYLSKVQREESKYEVGYSES